MTAEELEALKRTWLARVKAAACSGRLLRVTELYTVLWCWAQWSDSTDLKNWTSNALRDDASAIVILCAMVSESSSQTLGGCHVEDNSRIDRTTLEQFCERNVWQELDARIKIASDLTDKEKRAIPLFKNAMRHAPTN